MKHLFIALLCTLFGLSTYASDVLPKKNLPLASKNALTVKVAEANESFDLQAFKNENTNNFFRVQRVFYYFNWCGTKRYAVYVSGPNSSTYDSLYNFSWDWFQNSDLYESGC